MKPNEVRPALIAACPELAVPFAEADADDYADLPYLQMAAVARYLGERMRKGETDGFGPLFRAVEDCIVRGDNEAQTLVIVGLLEDLQNTNVTQVNDLSLWAPYLGPASLRAWEAVERFWDGDGVPLWTFEVLPEETAGSDKPE